MKNKWWFWKIKNYYNIVPFVIPKFMKTANLFVCLFQPLSSTKRGRRARKYPLKCQWCEWVEVNKISPIQLFQLIQQYHPKPVTKDCYFKPFMLNSIILYPSVIKQKIVSDIIKMWYLVNQIDKVVGWVVIRPLWLCSAAESISLWTLFVCFSHFLQIKRIGRLESIH